MEAAAAKRSDNNTQLLERQKTRWGFSGNRRRGFRICGGSLEQDQDQDQEQEQEEQEEQDEQEEQEEQEEHEEQDHAPSDKRPTVGEPSDAASETPML